MVVQYLKTTQSRSFFIYSDIIYLMESVVKIKNLSITLGGHVKALKQINLELPKGKITGFIGPSGAGKTTLIKCIVGGLKVPEGSVKVFNQRAGSIELRKVVRYMSQELSVYQDLTVKENLKYFSIISGLSRKETNKTINELLKTIDMQDKCNFLVSDLSGGQKQRVSLAISLIGSPKLMVLDEPTIGLDPALRESLWQLFHKIADQGTTLIISSHSMDEASRCEDLVLIREGTIIAKNSPKDLLNITNTKTVEQAFLKLAGNKG